MRSISLKNISPWYAVLVAVSVIINFVLREGASALQLPFRLFEAGTCFSAAVGGPVCGVITAAATYLINGIWDPGVLNYSLAGLAAALTVGVVFPKKHEEKELYPIIASGVLAGLVSTVFSTPFNLILYGGRTNNLWGDGLFDLLSGGVTFKGFSAFLAEAFINVPDKVVSVILAAILLYLLEHIPGKTAVMIALFAVGNVFAVPYTASAAELLSDYAMVNYDTDDGLVSAEINALAQTRDGYIYAGTYSGLYCYDGSRFSYAIQDERISSVMQLFSDSSGRLWIGTNDSGLCCYDIDSGRLEFYDVSNGLPANAVRAIAEDSDGNIYVGTVSALAVISRDGKLSVVESEDALDTRSLSAGEDNIVAGVTNDGILYFVKNGRVVFSDLMEEESGTYYCAVAASQKGEYMVGTGSNFAIRMSFNGKKLKEKDRIYTGERGYFNRLLYDEELSGFLFCCENGLGFLGDDGRVTDLSTDSFSSSISDVMVDYQDNIWFTSNKQGMVRFSKNPFSDVFTVAGVEPKVVNALMISNGLLYAGTDDGLVVIDEASGHTVEESLSAHFEGMRVRHLMEDSEGNIWVATYGTEGLVKIGTDGSFTSFNEQTAQTVGDRFRLTLELKDGTIAAASSTGLNFIRNGAVKGTLTEKDGLGTQILSMVEQEDGTIIAGTDGDGIAIIKNGRIRKKIGEEDGLKSLVVLRVVPCEYGYIYVTSNAIYFDDGKSIKKLDKFPYSNNYDVYLPQDGSAWVSSSAGIYIVNLKDLIKNSDYNYTLLNHTRGFHTTLTANAKDVSEKDMLYLCCTDGVRKISVKNWNSFDEDYEIRLSELMAGDDIIKAWKGSYIIPPTSERIQFQVSVLNYTFSNPLIRMYLEGTNDSGITCHQNELQPLTFTNMSYGDYLLHVQILDESTEEVYRDETFPVEKEAQTFEEPAFKIYLTVICVLAGMFVFWSFGEVGRHIKHMNLLQKEATIDAMTGLLNKSASKNQITEACRTKKGILMMIDLDSFKLVNDIYGHDMGDRILIRFSELIKASIRSTDLAGRMGGDEFIAFLRDNSDVHSIEEKTEFINVELVKSAKEYMGEDMNIPLGASIGAVLVPDEGTDFEDLYRKADKALYNVKQNGKHGCAVYGMGHREEETEGTSKTGGVGEIAMILGERNIGRGAYVLDSDKLQVAYRLLERLGTRYMLHVHMVEFILSPEEGSDVPEDVTEAFLDLLVNSLRNSDVVSDRSKGKYFVLLSEIETCNSEIPIKRIITKFEKDDEFDGYLLSYEEAAMV